MSYNFTFDLTKLSKTLFKDIAESIEKGKLPHKIGAMARNLVKQFNVNKITGLPIGDSITVMEDLININVKNSIERETFLKTKKRALFLPHCCRKYMDSRCKADFMPESSSYKCNHCSKDCLISRATKIAEKENYDVYVLPGASCVRKIIIRNNYDGIVGVACTDELKLAEDILEEFNISSQGIPLLRNGCSDTEFNFDTLVRVIKSDNN